MTDISPLTDCTNAVVQAMNRTPTTAKHAVRTYRHDPYACKLLAPEESVDSPSYGSSPLTSYESPLNWEARSFEPAHLRNAGTPYVVPHAFTALSMPAMEEVSRPLFQGNTSMTSDGTGKSSSNLFASHGTAPMKDMGKIYVGGRPVAVRRFNNEVTVELRGGISRYLMPDIYLLLSQGEDHRELIGMPVIVEGDRGVDYGLVRSIVKDSGKEGSAEGDSVNASVSSDRLRLPRVLRCATDGETSDYQMLDQLEEEALSFCQKTLQDVRLEVPIEVVRAIFQLDRKKLTFQYRSSNYVDFNELTRVLHKRYDCRIWMDQLNRAECSSDRRPRRGGAQAGRNGGQLRRRHY